MQCDCYFHLHHQLKNLKVSVTKGISTMCPGFGKPYFLPPICLVWGKGSLKF